MVNLFLLNFDFIIIQYSFQCFIIKYLHFFKAYFLSTPYPEAPRRIKQISRPLLGFNKTSLQPFCCICTLCPSPK